MMTEIWVMLPVDERYFRLPDEVKARLQHLLDVQDQGIELTPAEREEAEFLVALSEFGSLVNLRADRLRQSDDRS